MSYKEDLKKFLDLKSQQATNKKGEELINWYLSYTPFGYYYAAEMLWKKADQRSMDEAIRYYKAFVEHNDIREEANEVKNAIKIVLKAYREGYGSQEEQLSAAHAFEQTVSEKNFKFPSAKKVATETDRDNRAKKDGRFSRGIGILSILTTLALGAISLIKGKK